MNEEKIQQLLVGDLGDPTTVRFQKKLLDMVVEAGRKKYGAISDKTLQVEAIRYFLARGVLDWEAQQSRNFKERKGIVVVKRTSVRKGSAHPQTPKKDDDSSHLAKGTP